MNEADILRHYFAGQAEGVMVDVGAHRGSSCAPFLGDGWSVYAFEPDIENRQQLEGLAARHPKLSIDARAVSDHETAAAVFYTSTLSTGISSLSAFDPSHAPAGSVEVTTLRAFCKAKEIDRVDFLKVDTEGHDLFVLKGFPWESIRPAVVLCEFEDRKTGPLGYNYRDMGNLLVENGYRVLVSEWHPIIAYGEEHSWASFKDFPTGLECPESWGNLIGFRDGIDWFRMSSSIAHSLVNSSHSREREVAFRLQRSDEELAYMKQSWSWRMTHPLRAGLVALKNAIRAVSGNGV